MKKMRPGLNFIVSVLLMLAVVATSAIIGDFYFDLNDDVLMKDILSGAYTGVPAGHNIQMLYPISAFIALLYRVIRTPDWYGIFLCACQFFCLSVLSLRLMETAKSAVFKAASAVFVLALALGGIFPHLIFVQYTFTCGLLSMTAAFLIMTAGSKGAGDYILPVALIIIAYLIRTEMLLLTLPVTFVGIFIRWVLERMQLKDSMSDGTMISGYGERKKLFCGYVILTVTILGGIAISSVINAVAYSPKEWKQFNALFDARTELYDFQFIPDYEQNREFYDSIGLSEAEQKLLENYNFGIDEEIDAEVLSAVAKYASQLKTDETPLLTRLLEGIKSYLYRLRYVAWQKSYEYPMTDAPLNLIAVLLYLGVAAVYVFMGDKGKKLSALLMIALLFACRTSLWLFIIVRGRDPIRITHPLYLMEIAVLLGMLAKAEAQSRRYAAVPLLACAVAAAVFIPNQVNIIRAENADRAVMRGHYDALYQYFEDNPDNFYFVDVYTSVSAAEGEEKTFSEKMFEDVNNDLANFGLMGGWASKSPLDGKKYEAFGFDSMQSAILEGNVYVVNKISQDIEWLRKYYLDKGIETQITKQDTVGDMFVIYSVRSIE
jgi:hypothetical protein